MCEEIRDMEFVVKIKERGDGEGIGRTEWYEGVRRREEKRMKERERERKWVRK